MEAFLRDWQQSAADRHQYTTAIFVGDKLLALTGSDEDAFALAQTHYAAGNYAQALSLIKRSDSLQRSAASRYLMAHCHIKQNRHEDALVVLGEKNAVHLIATSDSARRKLQHLSGDVPKKQPGKSRLAGRHERADRSEERDLEDASNIKYEAGMCYLRGLCYANQNAFDRAKACYKDAVRIDIQCFEAFDQLMKNSLMSPSEEWELLDSLDFDGLQSGRAGINAPPEAADFVRNLYTMRLSKYTRPEEFGSAVDTLSTHYRMSDNADVLLAKAEMLHTSLRHEAALALTSRILDDNAYNFTCLPLHIALLYKLEHKNALFSLSHELADTHPEEPCTWLAVGTYYLITDRIPEARSFFSKASLMDPHFGPAWIGFAHTFAAEGEGDQAIAAYSTAARLFQGTHLPQLFLGMQEIALGNMVIAREYLTTAYRLCDRDPQVINELGVVSYMEDDYDSAIRSFQLALRIADDNEAPPRQYVETRLNLAHALRCAGRFHDALYQFEEVIRLGMREAGVFAGKGLVLMQLDQPFEAVITLHESLALSPQDPIASDLLAKALALLDGDVALGRVDEEAVDTSLRAKLADIKKSRARSGPGGRTRRRHAIQHEPPNGAGDEDMDFGSTNI